MVLHLFRPHELRVVVVQRIIGGIFGMAPLQAPPKPSERDEEVDASNDDAGDERRVHDLFVPPRRHKEDEDRYGQRHGHKLLDDAHGEHRHAAVRWPLRSLVSPEQAVLVDRVLQRHAQQADERNDRHHRREEDATKCRLHRVGVPSRPVHLRGRKSLLLENLDLGLNLLELLLFRGTLGLRGATVDHLVHLVQLLVGELPPLAPIQAELEVEQWHERWNQRIHEQHRRRVVDQSTGVVPLLGLRVQEQQHARGVEDHTDAHL
mmetsp:Transcript_14881/g.42894  ORF Transcript_14881/g.42894 Transcript_14881/m.42894 type:complete len:263 (+) Transcript_14881:774-1562(+)